MLICINGELRFDITHRNLENWEDLKTLLKNTYMEKHVLDFHTKQLFGARHNIYESVYEWIHNIQRLSSKLRKAALQDCEEYKSVGIVALAEN